MFECRTFRVHVLSINNLPTVVQCVTWRTTNCC